MKTTYLGIESIVIQYYDKITIAANVMFRGQNYDQPVYTNIFCDYMIYRLLGTDKQRKRVVKTASRQQ